MNYAGYLEVLNDYVFPYQHERGTSAWKTIIPILLKISSYAAIFVFVHTGTWQFHWQRCILIIMGGILGKLFFYRIVEMVQPRRNNFLLCITGEWLVMFHLGFAIELIHPNPGGLTEDDGNSSEAAVQCFHRMGRSTILALFLWMINVYFHRSTRDKPTMNNLAIYILIAYVGSHVRCNFAHEVLTGGYFWDIRLIPYDYQVFITIFVLPTVVIGIIVLRYRWGDGANTLWKILSIVLSALVGSYAFAHLLWLNLGLAQISILFLGFAIWYSLGHFSGWGLVMCMTVMTLTVCVAGYLWSIEDEIEQGSLYQGN